MALREVIGTDNPILRHKGKKIRKITSELQTLIDDMVETMRAAPGVGLAAPQVGESLRLFVAEVEENSDVPGSGQLYIVINPEYLYQSENVVSGVEGCLSIPGYLGEVERHTTIVIRGLDRHGRKIKLEMRDWLARVFQHEIDHLDGILYTDHIDDPDKIWEVEEGSEEQAEAEFETARAAESAPADSPTH